MAACEGRIAHWLEVVSELMERPLTELPLAVILRELQHTFEVSAVSWNWRDANGTFGFAAVSAEPFRLPIEHQAQWRRGDLLCMHPLVRWFDTTGDPTPQTSARVPDSVSPPAERGLVQDILRPMRADQQLSMPYLLDGTRHRAFVLARDGDDFSADDLAVAAGLVPAFRGLAAVSRVLAGAPQTTSANGAEALLTGRERAVVLLLADGHTASGIARRLAISPRTVHKHLERIYRKLGVADRLTAVRVAQDLDLIARPQRLPMPRRPVDTGELDRSNPVRPPGTAPKRSVTAQLDRAV